jgi:glycosyltransferase involved in cell wall biosynthesis
MSCGLPVVTTDIRGCREAVVHGETGLIVPPRNGVALAQAVTCFLGDPGLARRMGLQGRARAIALYDQKLVQQRFVRGVQDELRRLDLARERA